ncbi:E3 ubiquitin-protein ligase Iruka isoform X1 [Anopheles bellator]|uniref:E3 ubiquitin-protein ligase Iruka isoform X1 n=1 Tax=Anopheles bellator TaxID=139047 RepID=UPI002649DB85|nr:E3 ubiquitin-protein ligase Iruka isoform X1 [Anopheles bellator]XP_058056964.1 E3 ubiquitin-protein ligase Iruka isoform X1 [Anopheles bellator]
MEAMVENSANPPARFYCHSCSVEIDSVSSEFTCPHCSKGFIEELPAADRNGASGSSGSGQESEGPANDYVNAQQISSDAIGRLAGELFTNSFLPPFYHNNYDEESAGGSSGSGGSRYTTFTPEDIPPFSQSPQAATGGVGSVDVATGSGNGGSGSNTAMTNGAGGSSGTSLHRASLGRRGGRRHPMQNITHLDHILREILISVTDVGPGGMPMFFMGNPGDYAWGREGIDSIVTQLLNQMDNTGPPPLEKERIAEIPIVTISDEQVDRKLQCSVCFEDFQSGETVRKLPCLHVYHEPCIIPWLELHGTCPICRKSLTPDGLQSGSQAQSQQAMETGQHPHSLENAHPQQSSPSSQPSPQQQNQHSAQQQQQQPSSQSAAGGRQNPNFVAFTIRDLLPMLSGPSVSNLLYDLGQPSGGSAVSSSLPAAGGRSADGGAAPAPQVPSGGGGGSTASSSGAPTNGSTGSAGNNANNPDDDGDLYYTLDLD